MSDKPAVMHLLGRDCGWEESWFALSLASAMAGRGMRAALAAPEDSWAGKNAATLGAAFEPFDAGSAANPLGWFRLAGLAKKLGAGVVHAHGKSAATILARAWLPGGCRRAVSVYAGPIPAKEGFVAKANHVFAASRHVAGDLPVRENDGKYRLVYCGSDAAAAEKDQTRREAERAKLRDAFCPDKEKPLFLAYFAPFAEASRHQLLFEAMPEILARLPQTHLFLVGDGPLYPEVERQSRITALEKDVTFLESEADFPSLLEASDLCVSLRGDDGAGIVFQAAMAAGRAVAAVPAGCYPELIEDGKTGALIGVDSPAALAESLLDLLHNRNRRDHLGRMAAARASKSHSLSLAVDTMVKAYASASF